MAKAKKPPAKRSKAKARPKQTAPKRKTHPQPAQRSPAAARAAQPGARVIPGQYLLRDEAIVANADRQAVEVSVANLGDRPIQVGSHFHFYEVNRALEFERRRAYGMRLDIAAGTAVRFEPGQTKTVALVALGGQREVWGFNALVNGPLR